MNTYLAEVISTLESTMPFRQKKETIKEIKKQVLKEEINLFELLLELHDTKTFVNYILNSKQE